MDMGNSGSDTPDFDAWERSAEYRLVLSIAQALREEFGVGIDAHPGGIGSEPGVANRAFRATARIILGNAVSPGDDPAAVLTWVLRQTALRRLTDFGVVEQQAETLLDMEPGLGERWLAYLALAPGSVIGDMIADGSESH
jgi:hypothetical protein